MRRLPPREKKLLSYARDRRNAYGANDKASRKGIPRRKRQVSKTNRHAVHQQLSAVAGQVDSEWAEAVEIRMRGVRSRSWRKWPDQPLGQVLVWKRQRAMRRQSP